MSTNDLPDKAAEILRRLRRKYKTEFETLRFRDRELKILQVSDIEPLLKGKDPFSDVANFPFWVKLWESAMILADTVVNIPLDGEPTLLELGAGLGAPGLAAAMAGHKVTLSDYEPHILDFQRVSAAVNGLDGVEFVKLDWLKPKITKKFNTIIGAEILFRDDFFEPLLSIMRKNLAEGGTIYLAHDARRKSLKPFLDIASEHFRIAAMVRKLTTNDKEVTVVMNRLQPLG